MPEQLVIDAHGHVTSPELFKRFPMPPSLADVEGMIERKAALGIDTETPSAPGLSAAVEVFGPGHVLFGTDSPPLATSDSARPCANSCRRRRHRKPVNRINQRGD